MLRRVISDEYLETREFAFKYTVADDSIGRPVCFDNMDGVKAYLGTQGPNKAYVAGFYGRKFPKDKDLQKTVRKNEWLGRELCWDIDMDHYMNIRKNICECGTSKTVCNKCLELAKEAVVFLIETLVEDFGVDRDEIVTIFSGRQGFHIWVRNLTRLFHNEYNFPPKTSTRIEGELRQAIAEYCNLVTEKRRRRNVKGEVETKHIISVNVDTLPRSLRERVLNLTFKNLVMKSPPETLKEIKGVKARVWEKIKIDLCDASGYDVYMKHFSQLTPAKSKALKSKVLELRYPRFDIGCTKDIHRIMKIPGGIDGSTGNMCVVVDDLESFSLEDVPNIRDFIKN